MVSFPLFILKLVTKFVEIGRRVHVVRILSSDSTEPEESKKKIRGFFIKKHLCNTIVE